MNDLARRTLAERLRRARRQCGLSQGEVAKRLRVPRPAISNIEAGHRKVDAVELAQLASIYDRPIGYFTDGVLDAQVEHVLEVARELSDQDCDEVLRFAEQLKRSR